MKNWYPWCKLSARSTGHPSENCRDPAWSGGGQVSRTRECVPVERVPSHPNREWLKMEVFGWSWSGTAVAQLLRGSTCSTAFWARESWSMRCQSVSRLEARSTCWRATHASSSDRSTRTCHSRIASHPLGTRDATLLTGIREFAAIVVDLWSARETVVRLPSEAWLDELAAP